jgi:hypothetical protein
VIYPIDDVPMALRNEFEIWSRYAKDRGCKRFSAKMVLCQIRWYTMMKTGDDGFKVNDKWCKTLAEWLMRERPEFAGFFETRDRA